MCVLIAYFFIEVEHLNIEILQADADTPKQVPTTHRKHRFGAGILRSCCEKGDFISFNLDNFIINRRHNSHTVFCKRLKEKEMNQQNEESSTFEECE
jgi:hypothetical protein